MNWQAKANKADASIRKVGFDVTLIRPAVEATGNPWEPAPRAEERFSGTGLILSNAFRFVDGAPVRTGDLKLIAFRRRSIRPLTAGIFSR